LAILITMFGATYGGEQSRAEDAPTADNLAADQLIAWCIVPFDAQHRDPAQRAAMLKRLGLRRVAYDWRAEHVPTFEQEILQYQKHRIEFFAFWDWHPSMEELLRKYPIRPQFWLTAPSPVAASQDERVAEAVRTLLPRVEATRRLGCQLGLYNHGGWGGEPQNLVAVCRRLRKQADAPHVGIVYNFHHAHNHIDDFAEAFSLVKPYLLCLNLNGMNRDAQPKILPIGQGQHERRMIEIVRDAGYQGPIGILDHREEVDAEVSLRANLEGLARLREVLDRPEGEP
jgi:sugar phosphate isomerase/epimerase